MCDFSLMGLLNTGISPLKYFSNLNTHFYSSYTALERLMHDLHVLEMKHDLQSLVDLTLHLLPRLIAYAYCHLIPCLTLIALIILLFFTSLIRTQVNFIPQNGRSRYHSKFKKIDIHCKKLNLFQNSEY